MDPTTEPGSPTWRAAQAARLVPLAEAAMHPAGGFGWLGDDGTADLDRPRELWITARMTHVLALATLADPSRSDHWRSAAGHGVAALVGLFADTEHGGWVRSVDATGAPLDTDKANYDHCFVLLAASSAVAAGVDGGDALLAAAREIVETRFWRDDEGRCVERWDRTWTALEPYRGANSNMHAVEAFTACTDVSGERVWRDRALTIAGHVVNDSSRAHAWRLPEHFDPQWRPVLDFNDERRADPFRPYGATPGHWFEWARLLVGLHAGHPDAMPPGWLLEAAVATYTLGREVAWAADGCPGFPYTLDWRDGVVVAERMHWVACEAVAAADVMARSVDLADADRDARTWWAQLAASFVDDLPGWRHEVDAEGHPSGTVWTGRPDLYHAYQACLLPELPVAPAPAAALRALAHTRQAGPETCDVVPFEEPGRSRSA